MVECHKWAVIFPRNDADVTKQFLQSLNQVCSGMGFVISAPRQIEIPDNRTATYVNALKPVTCLKVNNL